MNIRIFKNKNFTKFALGEDITDEKLRQAIREAESGVIDANYGGGVIKQRISRPNQGTSGGYRTVILYRKNDKAFFVYGFAKNDRANITKLEEREFKALAKITLSFSDDMITDLLKKGIYTEIKHNA